MFILWLFCYAAFWFIFPGTVSGRYMDEDMKINFLLMVTSIQVYALFHNNTSRHLFYFHKCRVSVYFAYSFFTSHDVIAGNPSVKLTRKVHTCIKESNAHKYRVMNLSFESRTIFILLDMQNFSSKLSSQNHSLLWIFFALCTLCRIHGKQLLAAFAAWFFIVRTQKKYSCLYRTSVFTSSTHLYGNNPSKLLLFLKFLFFLQF